MEYTQVSTDWMVLVVDERWDDKLMNIQLLNVVVCMNKKKLQHSTILILNAVLLIIIFAQTIISASDFDFPKCN